MRESGPWVRLVLALALLGLPALSGLRRTEATNHMEVMTLASSQFTQRAAGADGSWMIPQWNGQPRIHKPPLANWIQLTAWWGLPPDAPVDQLVWRARLTGLAAALVMVASTFWLGWLLAGPRVAGTAALVAATCFFALREARMASYDVYLAGFCALAVAGGLHACRRPRAILRWLPAAAGLAGAILTKGPVALVFILIPWAAWLALDDPARRRGWPGLLAVLALGLLPWALWESAVLRLVPEAVARTFTEYRAARTDPESPLYYLALAGWVLPWTFWFLSALVAGLRRGGAADGAAPRALRAAAVAAVAVVVVMSLAEAKKQRYLYPLVPSVGVLVALLAQRLEDLRPRTRLGGLHAGLLAAVSVLAPVLLLGQGKMMALGWLKKPLAGDLPAFLLAMLLAALVALAAWVRRSASAGRWHMACTGTAVWFAILAAAYYEGYSRGPAGRYAWRGAAESWARSVQGADAGFVTRPGRRVSEDEPDESFLLYARRTIPHRDVAQIEAGRSDIALLLARSDPAWLARLQAAGWTPAETIRDRKGPLVVLTRAAR